MEGEFLGYFRKWKQSIQERNGFSKAAKSAMFLTSQTYQGLEMTGIFILPLSVCIKYALTYSFLFLGFSELRVQSHQVSVGERCACSVYQPPVPRSIRVSLWASSRTCQEDRQSNLAQIWVLFLIFCHVSHFISQLFKRPKLVCFRYQENRFRIQRDITLMSKEGSVSFAPLRKRSRLDK